MRVLATLMGAFLSRLACSHTDDANFVQVNLANGDPTSMLGAAEEELTEASSVETVGKYAEGAYDAAERKHHAEAIENIDDSRSHCGRRRTTAVEKGQWFEWHQRLPSLTSRRKQEPDSKDMAAVWTALGENWWWLCIDGRDHKRGKYAYEGTEISLHNQQDGKHLGHCKEMYENWSKPETWASFSQRRWQVEDLAALDMRLQGKHCDTAHCSEAYGINHVCFFDEEAVVWTKHCKKMAREFGFAEYGRPLNVKEKKVAVKRMVTEYYDAIDGSAGPGDNIVEEALPHLIRLHAALADIHPFYDANSRTRLMVLQSELVRLGGHPILIESAHSVYDVEPNPQAHEKLILDGYCMYEAAVRNRRSPFIHEEDAMVYDEASSSCQPKCKADGTRRS